MWVVGCLRCSGFSFGGGIVFRVTVGVTLGVFPSFPLQFLFLMVFWNVEAVIGGRILLALFNNHVVFGIGGEGGEI